MNGGWDALCWLDSPHSGDGREGTGIIRFLLRNREKVDWKPMEQEGAGNYRTKALWPTQPTKQAAVFKARRMTPGSESSPLQPPSFSPLTAVWKREKQLLHRTEYQIKLNSLSCFFVLAKWKDTQLEDFSVVSMESCQPALEESDSYQIQQNGPTIVSSTVGDLVWAVRPGGFVGPISVSSSSFPALSP